MPVEQDAALACLVEVLVVPEDRLQINGLLAVAHADWHELKPRETARTPGHRAARDLGVVVALPLRGEHVDAHRRPHEHNLPQMGIVSVDDVMACGRGEGTQQLYRRGV